MLKTLRQKIEGKRNSKKFLWRFLVFIKDFIWGCTIGLPQVLRDIRLTIKLPKIDSARVPYSPDEIRVFMVVRNESLRLPYIFKYYSKMGVDRFFVIDNGSTDGTTSFLLSQKNTHVFKTNESYGKYNYGNEWIRVLLGKYGKGHWCLVVDADEIFIYPHYEKVSLRDLCNFLDKEGSTAMSSMLLDMYSDKQIKQTEYKKGEDPLSAFPYFDRDTHYRATILVPRYGNISLCVGGMRERVFGITMPYLSKTPLLKFTPRISLVLGQHYVLGVDLSKTEAAVLHFKYASDFIPRVLEEAKREEHFNNAEEYKGYAKKIIKNPNINPYYSGSAKFKNSEQLVGLKIMKTSEEFELFIKNNKI